MNKRQKKSLGNVYNNRKHNGQRRRRQEGKEYRKNTGKVIEYVERLSQVSLNGYQMWAQIKDQSLKTLSEAIGPQALASERVKIAERYDSLIAVLVELLDRGIDSEVAKTLGGRMVSGIRLVQQEDEANKKLELARIKGEIEREELERATRLELQSIEGEDNIAWARHRALINEIKREALLRATVEEYSAEVEDEDEVEDADEVKANRWFQNQEQEDDYMASHPLPQVFVQGEEEEDEVVDLGSCLPNQT